MNCEKEMKTDKCAAEKEASVEHVMCAIISRAIKESRVWWQVGYGTMVNSCLWFNLAA